MPTDLAPIRPFPPAAEMPRPGAAPGRMPAEARAQREPSSLAVAAAAAAPPNPALRLESALGVVVIEIRDTAGRVAQSIPTARELALYRAAVMTDAPLPPGTPPLLRTPPGTTPATVAASEHATSAATGPRASTPIDRDA